MADTGCLGMGGRYDHKRVYHTHISNSNIHTVGWDGDVDAIK